MVQQLNSNFPIFLIAGDRNQAELWRRRMLRMPERPEKIMGVDDFYYLIIGEYSKKHDDIVSEIEQHKAHSINIDNRVSLKCSCGWQPSPRGKGVFDRIQDDYCRVHRC